VQENYGFRLGYNWDQKGSKRHFWDELGRVYGSAIRGTRSHQPASAATGRAKACNWEFGIRMIS